MLLLALGLAVTPAAAKTVHFDGRAVRVPAGWPVYRLAEQPQTCVRLDRRAVYLGTPGAEQRCPAEAMGARRAILVEPRAAIRARAAASAVEAPPPSSSGPVSSPEAFTGLGFDACAAPSSRAMAAWAASPYRGIGVYIGGSNRGCSQPNLTAKWVEEQVADGWHLIPTYVGLQAPTSACSSCAALSAAKAAQQGVEAASDAVEDAVEVGMGPGSPIYFDMEAYTRTSSASNAVLTFLSAWTSQLHTLGYVSGVYSSSSSGIADLGRATASTTYTLPDHVWTANWNGQQNTLDPYLPSTAWANHQRIHQYRGGHNESYGLTTINIDNNYIDGATVGATLAAPELPPLTVKHVKPEGGALRVWVRCGWAEGESCPGQIILRTHARVPLRARRGVPTKVVRLNAAHRTFRLAGGKSHSFRIALNERAAPLLRLRGELKAQLLVAIPDARATRAVRLKLGR
ncbi:MAG TPA: DUF1906 domain-containing protein [Solirubrobacterales bacterium]|nr:DUF1906 domain-containing protein [Solirubrobacterales bacterium]